jgi:hypothetical protein
MVAGNHLDADAGGLAVGHGADGLFAGRVHDARQAQQGETALQVGELQFRLARWHGGKGQGQHPLAALAQGLHLALPPGEIEGLVLAGLALMGAPQEHLFRGALDVGKGVAVVVVVQGGHEAMLGFERNDVAAGQGLGLERGVQAHLVAQGEQGPLGGIALQVPVAPGSPAGGRRCRAGRRGPVPPVLAASSRSSSRPWAESRPGARNPCLAPR